MIAELSIEGIVLSIIIITITVKTLIEIAQVVNIPPKGH